MKNSVIKAFLFSALLTYPIMSYAQTDSAAQGDSKHCPTVDTAMLQKNMGAMMSNMNAMMTGTSDPAIKERMRKMHDQMASMMSNMRQGGSGSGAMMGGPAMHGGQDMVAPSANPSGGSENRDTHRLKQ